MPTIQHTTTLTTLECCKCGMPLGLSESWVTNAKEVGNFEHQFLCPYCGRKQGWGESQHAKAIAQLTRDKQRLANDLAQREKEKQDALAEADHFRRARDGMKGALQKVKIRVGRGVCPCCSRSFQNLREHMLCKHPGFAEAKTPENIPSDRT